MRKPPPLVAGSTVTAVASAGPPDHDKFNRGVEAIRALGLNVSVPADLLARKTRYLAGSAEDRLSELRSAYAQGTVWAARGGYGSMHLLTPLDFNGAPQLLIGFSDFTAIGCAMLKHDVPWVHGPLFTTIADEPAETQAHLLSVLQGRARGLSIKGETLRAGRAEGPLIGGSLALLAALAGTAYFPRTRGAILFLEDVGEQPYRLDRLWTQLELAGAFDGIAGLLLGHFTDCEPRDKSYTSRDVLHALAERAGVPTLVGVPFGHVAPNFAIPCGVRGGIADGALTLLEEVVDVPH
jgi:muramoyltetrapeptide carboxypeptidase